MDLRRYASPNADKAVHKTSEGIVLIGTTSAGPLRANRFNLSWDLAVDASKKPSSSKPRP
ncbi:hypothetical protein QCA50_021204 [Cerrena zonata]|uniref:Uncharacterized protein n=1 Tax=Cerrena zonata TaxID=2478898 RepID=A0AAW0FAR0_9APHY